MRLRSRVDSNQPAIVEALERAGAKVIHLHSVGSGCPDILVGRLGKFYLLEIKANAKAKFTAPQVAFFARFLGYPVFRVDSVASALEAIGVEIVKEAV